MRQKYQDIRFGESKRQMIRQANAILDEYRTRHGLVLTLRQLYYQFVARGYLANTVQNYKRLGAAVSDGRMAGLIDWDLIEDRTRTLRGVATWAGPRTRLKTIPDGFSIDKWKRQPTRPEVWVEKDALAGVVEQACLPLQVDYFSCRGYTSQSEMQVAGVRIAKRLVDGQNVHIIHLGDHDPSGIDMSADIEGRLNTFLSVEVRRRQAALARQRWLKAAQAVGWPTTAAWEIEDEPAAQDSLTSIAADIVRMQGRFTFQRVALNMDQIRELNPPPNPAKVTDSRYRAYRERFGEESWELDALPPDYMVDLITRSILAVQDPELWDEDVRREEKDRTMLRDVYDNWKDIHDFLDSRRQPNAERGRAKPAH